jgi:hypothetical protein
MNLIAFTALRLMLWVFYLLITSPFLGVLYFLSRVLDTHVSLHEMRWIVAIPGIAWFLGVGWIAHDTATHMMFEKQSLDKSMQLSLQAVRFHLSFLPLVGHWFTPTRPRNNDETNESDDH